MRVFLSNGKIAWELPSRIGFYYSHSYYLPPKGWEVIPWSLLAANLLLRTRRPPIQKLVDPVQRLFE